MSVTDGRGRFVDDPGGSDTLLNRLVIFEVLSEYMETLDRGNKFANYQQIPPLLEYVMVSQTDAKVELYRRQRDGETWLLTVVAGLDATIRLASVEVDLSLAEVYENVVFSPKPPIPVE